MENKKKIIHMGILLILAVTLVILGVCAIFKIGTVNISDKQIIASDTESSKKDSANTNDPKQEGQVDLLKLNNINPASIQAEQGGLVTRGTIIPLNDDNNKFTGDDRVSVDAVNVRDGINSVKLVKKATDKDYFRFTRKVNLSLIENDTIGFWIYKDNTSNLQSDAIVSVFLSTYSNDYNYYKVDIKATDLQDGWNLVKYKKKDFFARGSVEWNHIDGISFQIKAGNTADVSISVSSIEVNEKMKPTVVLCVDGNYSELTGYLFPLLKTYGFGVTNFLNSYNSIKDKNVSKYVQVKGADGKTKTQVVKEVQSINQFDTATYNQYISEGSIEIATSGINKNYLETIKQYDNADKQYAAFKENFDRINSMGLGNSVAAYALPSGVYNKQNDQVLKELGFALVRNADEGTITFYNSNLNNVPQVEILDGNLGKVKQYIDHCIQYNNAIVLYSNNVVAKNTIPNFYVSQSTYETVMKYLQEKVNSGQIQVVTAGQFINQGK